MKKFNKKQRDYLDKLVKETPTRIDLSRKLYDSYSFVDEDIAQLGQVWENQLTDIDRYVNDKFNEIHGAGYSISKYY